MFRRGQRALQFFPRASTKGYFVPLFFCPSHSYFLFFHLPCFHFSQVGFSYFPIVNCGNFIYFLFLLLVDRIKAFYYGKKNWCKTVNCRSSRLLEYLVYQFHRKKVSLLSLKFRFERLVLINYQISILCNLQLHLSFDRFWSRSFDIKLLFSY